MWRCITCAGSTQSPILGRFPWPPYRLKPPSTTYPRYIRSQISDRCFKRGLRSFHSPRRPSKSLKKIAVPSRYFRKICWGDIRSRAISLDICPTCTSFFAVIPPFFEGGLHVIEHLESGTLNSPFRHKVHVQPWMNPCLCMCIWRASRCHMRQWQTWWHFFDSHSDRVGWLWLQSSNDEKVIAPRILISRDKFMHLLLNEDPYLGEYRDQRLCPSASSWPTSRKTRYVSI